MGNVTDQATLQRLKLQLDEVLSSYRDTLRADELRLQIAMLEYAQSCRPEPLAKAA